MTENGFDNKIIKIKSEPDDCIQQCIQHLKRTGTDIIQKDLSLSPLNYEFDHDDIESINIDDIFNDGPNQDNWCLMKDNNEDNSKFRNELLSDVSILSDLYNPDNTNSHIPYNINETNLLPRFKLHSSQEENKLFFISDILFKEKLYTNSQINSNFISQDLGTLNKLETRKLHLPPLQNPHINYDNKSVISNPIPLKTESLLCLSSNNSNFNYLKLVSSNAAPIISKPKTILPVIGPSPKKKCLPIKIGQNVKQLCYICNDNATGKHYGIISCEGCKGFFKRTVRNNLSYTCRDFNNCAMDKKFRNRCQACRFHKCLQVGMKREAVQIERPEKRHLKSSSDNCEPINSSPSSVQTDESLEKLYSNLISQINDEYMLSIELKNNPDIEEREIFKGNLMKVICQHVNDHLFSIVSWAKYVPGFTILSLNDQTLLIKMSWGELVVANFTHRSLKLNADMILLRNGTKLVREIAELSGLEKLIDRIIYEVLHRFRDLKMDRCELSYIKAIILFNPNMRNLENYSFVQMIRDRLYSSLQRYCREKFPLEKLRFSKLLLRLPSLRSIAHHCQDHLRLYDIIDKCKSESVVDKSELDSKSPDSGFSFLDEMLGHSDITMDH